MNAEEPGSAPKRPPWSHFKAALEARGFHPSRRLGQNFLRDENLVRAIARDSAVGPGEPVLEVGAGCGFLTLHLAALGVPVLAVEIDRRLLEVAEELLGDAPGVELLHLDVLASKGHLAPEVLARLPARDPWHLVSNLPYSAGSPVMVLLSRLENPPRSMTALIQRDLAERILAPQGSAERGPFGLRLRAVYSARILRHVPPDAFWPRPQVESSVVRLKLRDPRPSREDLEELDALIDALFQQRRKALGGLLAGLLGDRRLALGLLAELGVEPAARPQDLSRAELERLAAHSLWRGRPRAS